MNTLTKFDLASSLRNSRLGPDRTAGTVLSLMLLWSQTPASKLKGLPSFRDASAEFILKDPSRVARTLAPELSDSIVSNLADHHSSELESLRRAVMNGLDAHSPVGEIADAILELCAPYASVASETSAILIAVLDAKKGSRVRCAFSYAMRTAWALANDVTVDLDIENADLAPLISILAAACDRSIKVQVNTIDSVAQATDAHDAAEHALIFPPIGMRLRVDRPSLSRSGAAIGDQISSESLGALWGAHAGKGRNIVVVGNGLLFRTSSKDAAFKQDLFHDHGLEAVISLPRGTFSGTAIAMSALVFSGDGRLKGRQRRIRFIDGSDSALDASALPELLDGKERQHPLCADASLEQISETGFNLSVDRYVLDAETRRTREMLNRQKTVRLFDLADIRRPQALPRESGKESTFEVREALLADIDNGRLSLPTKLSELPRSASTKIESAVLRPGDILLSIKGTIGKAALVTDSAIAESDTVPIVPGQSFVIVRLRKGGAITDPRALVSYLRSPLAQSLLHGMAGGTTIPNVAMGELKDMPVPIPNEQAQATLLKKFDEYSQILRDIDVLRSRMKITEDEMFNITLNSK
ncbi:N-6 DNA methylase [Bradyrhizobium sp. AUGA SZCCT0160]|uniref:N-6 DNA methylase n=1 Tax=Bradyrhizobium sp. AUGA SZCCT0160 TaxID=2807662 RepID=UPI001BA51E71|nr:N-6 DNA methylase [Bradyrhizobium sp. AUGA SZCCT0160]MBR1191486.1 N-6 DNA methylase [Bradyrhizobium sp. AUGA SZCCT0160]